MPATIYSKCEPGRTTPALDPETWSGPMGRAESESLWTANSEQTSRGNRQG